MPTELFDAFDLDVREVSVEEDTAFSAHASFPTDASTYLGCSGGTL
ncbi:hypothetical protein [Streptomyces tubercidicus]|nr:hypothetical protein OG690_12935 [Streptomyces tubercidicus]